MDPHVTLEATGVCSSGDVAPAWSGSKAFGTTRVAAGVSAAALVVGVELTASYARRIAADGLARCVQLGVTRLGEGVVIHTAPENSCELPIVLGYADAGGEWLRDGSRHRPEEAINP